MPPAPVVLCYVSGHGFGHAARVAEVLRALRARRPDVACAIRSPLARWFFDFNLGFSCMHGEARLDVGAVQADSLAVDLQATQRAYAAIDADAERLIDAEIAAVAPQRPAVVFADIPALAFEIARRLSVPGIAMANFSWDWIYADYAQVLPGFAPLVAALRAAYGRATLLLRLPLHGDLSAFPRIRDLPLVARRAGRDRSAVRAALGLPRDQRLVLISFGGLGLRLPRAPRLAGVTFVVTGGAAIDDVPPSGWRAVTHAEMTGAGVRYEDLVGACDVVMTKPGYGIVADCIANGTPMLYTERGRFAEYDCLVSGIHSHLPNAFISRDDLQAGRWAAGLDRLFSEPRRAPGIRIDGAEVAAETLAALLPP
jgi:UDP:flavonoid glycosyltransferase YjiC (YdhE family)